MFKNFKNQVRLARHPMRKMLFLCMIVLPYVRVRSLVPFGALCVQAYMRPCQDADLRMCDSFVCLMYDLCGHLAG